MSPGWTLQVSDRIAGFEPWNRDRIRHELARISRRIRQFYEHRHHQLPPGLELKDAATTINPQLMHLRNEIKGESQCHT